MRVSIEIPAFKGQWLVDCIDSVLRQTSPDWELSLIWDGGDDLARAIVGEIANFRDPRIKAYFGHRQGIARARRFLSQRSTAEWILALDDDDLLAPDAVDAFLQAARERPWAGIIRARRQFIDEAGQLLAMPEWFPFEPRHYQYGMVTDVFNHCQPYLIRRTAYERTAGWRGFEDFSNAGEDCDIFVQVEEAAPIELYDRVLYYYRLNPQRASHLLGPASAREMWRRIADESISRLGLPLTRVNDEPPFAYEKAAAAAVRPDRIDFIITGSGDADKTRLSLLDDGISDYAICIEPGPTPEARNRGFALSSQRLICFANAGATLPSRILAHLCQEVNAQGLDLAVHTEPGASQSFLFCRTEVVRAVGGFDSTFAHPDLATLDFCLKARRRDFACSPGSEWPAGSLGAPETPAAQLSLFLAKWAAQAAAAAAEPRTSVPSTWALS